MDLFVMPQLGNVFNLEVGRIISGYKRATWVERFVEASEFSIEAPLDSNLRETLPIGSYYRILRLTKFVWSRTMKFLLTEARILLTP